MTIVQFNLALICSEGADTAKTLFAAYDSEEDVLYALDRAYEGCNYVSSVEEVASLTGESEDEVISKFGQGLTLSYFERTDKQSWETSISWYWD